MILTNDSVAQDVLLCPLCSEHFTNPRVLPCQHTFCCACLSTYYNDRQASSRKPLSAIPCPTCRTICALPVLGVTAFPASPKMARVCNLLKAVDKVKKARKHNKHESAPATEPLLGPHLNRENNNVQFSFKDTRAKEHQYAGEAVDPENTVTDSSDETSEETDDNLQFETFHSYVECGVTDSSTEDIRQYEDVEQEKNLKNELNSNASEDLEDRQEEPEDVTYSSQSVYDPQPPAASCEDAVHVNSEQYDSGVEDGATCRVEEEEQNGEKHPEKEQCLQSGAIAEDAGIDEESKDIDQEKSDMGKEKLGHIYDTPQIYWQLERRDYEMPTAAVVLPCGKVIVADYGKCFIEIYEEDGTFVKTVDGVKPYSLCVNSDGRFVVGDRLDKTVKIFDANGELYDEWTKGKFDWICGIAQNKATNFVIYDRQHCKIGFYDDFENCVSSFGRYGNKKDQELCFADFLTIDEEDQIIICDSGSHMVKVFNQKGRFLYSFGGRGSRDGQLLWPKGVTTDSLGNIIVTDQRNDRVSMFSADGVFIQHLIEDWPRPYNVSCAGDLLTVCSYTLNGHSKVAVYRLDQLAEQL